MLLLFKLIFTGRMLQNLSTPSVKSLPECSVHCYNIRSCHSFFYIKYNNTCSIASELFQYASEQLTDFEDGQYWEKKNDYCPLDYTLLPGTSMCIKVKPAVGDLQRNKRSCAKEAHGGRLAILFNGTRYIGVKNYIKGQRISGIQVGETDLTKEEVRVAIGQDVWCPNTNSAAYACLAMVAPKNRPICLDYVRCSSLGAFLCEKPMNVMYSV